MKCPKCNYELTGGTDLPEEDVKYCYNCGKKINTCLFKGEEKMKEVQRCVICNCSLPDHNNGLCDEHQYSQAIAPKYFINGHLCPAKLWRMLLRTETKLGPEMLTITKQPNDFSYKSGKYHFQKIYPKGGTKK